MLLYHVEPKKEKEYGRRRRRRRETPESQQPEEHNRVSCVRRPASSLLHRSNGILRQCIGIRCVCSVRVCTIYDPSSTLTPSACAVLLCTSSRQPSNLLSRHGAQCYALQADNQAIYSRGMVHSATYSKQTPKFVMFPPESSNC